MMTAPSKSSLTNRSAWWALEFTKVLAASSELRVQIPKGAKICVMPAEDPEVGEYNMSLVMRNPSETVVFVRLERQGDAYTVVPYLPQRASRHPAA